MVGDEPFELGGFRFAAAVDGVTAAGEPVLAPERGHLTDAKRRDRVLTYLRAGAPVLRGDGADPDLFDPARRASVPVAYRTDGRWIWPDAVEYYLARYFVAPEPEFAERIVRFGFRCPLVPAGTAERARAALAERDRVAGRTG